MVWGALGGRMLGMIVQSLCESYPHWEIFRECPSTGLCITPGMYALLGAMASLGGTTKLTVSLTIIMFELTGNLNYIIPCMITLMIAKIVGDQFVHGGMSELLIKENKYPFLDPRENEIFGTTVGIHMNPVSRLQLIYARMSNESILGLLESTHFSGYPVVESKSDRSLIGYISRQDLMSNVLPTHEIVVFDTGDVKERCLDLSHLVDKTPLAVDPRVSIEFVIDLFKKLGVHIYLC